MEAQAAIALSGHSATGPAPGWPAAPRAGIRSRVAISDGAAGFSFVKRPGQLLRAVGPSDRHGRRTVGIAPAGAGSLLGLTSVAGHENFLVVGDGWLNAPAAGPRCTAATPSPPTGTAGVLDSPGCCGRQQRRRSGCGACTGIPGRRPGIRRVAGDRCRWHPSVGRGSGDRRAHSSRLRAASSIRPRPTLRRGRR